MVQLLAHRTLSQNGAPIHETAEGRKSSAVKQESREEHALRVKELNMKRSMMRAPRRGWSMTDYQGEHAAPHHFHGAALHVERQASIPENAVLPPPVAPIPAPTGKMVQSSRRPKLPPPRRSYSVTDKEPESVAPLQPRPSSRMTLLDLPSELHYSLFDFLDPIDGVCLGLAHSRLYDIHRRKYGAVPLCSRYSGPNDMEWAWRGAGPLIRPVLQTSDKEGNSLDQLRVKGQVYCRKCGISRCELHRHLKDWIGEGYEYCEIKKVYGKPADEDAISYCFMSSPKNPHRCGRHGGKKM
ncbi:hypothetical protein TOPH_05763 [Tolypocladium ophioglossoides CBS 100239]|uniref:F-box domain-containing protein n=1 Tax=Tolypocladium ophioglossoides (strain CBS 100239) TaxID=1163406 RepID=A0A0L0N6I3_TOLOC|nr:hypothetical protein TOPH_05763 [Tolypocladium ophioglossoides CBS 100239]